MIRQWGVGVFPSVALLEDGRGLMAVREGDPRQPGALVVYEWTGTDLAGARERNRLTLPAGSPCFPNLYTHNGLVWLAFHNGTRQVLLCLDAAPRRELDGLSNPTAFGGQWWAYTEPAQPYRVHRLDLVTGEASQPRLGAPTGLSRMLDDGTVITVDEDRHALPSATIPCFAGPLAVGEGPRGGVQWRHGSLPGSLWEPLDSFTPKCAADNGRFAISTAGSGSVRLFCGSLEELIAASGTIPTPPVQPPLPPFPPNPEPEPMQAKALPDDVYQIVVQLYERNLELANSPNDDDRRALAKKIAETARARKGGQWGWKSNHGIGNANAKDAIAQLPDGASFQANQRQSLYIWDLFNGTTRKPNGSPIASETENYEQFFVPVDPVDHLTGGPGAPDPPSPPPQPPTPPPTGDVTNAQVLAAVLKLSQHLGVR